MRSICLGRRYAYLSHYTSRSVQLRIHCASRSSWLVSSSMLYPNSPWYSSKIRTTCSHTMQTCLYAHLVLMLHGADTSDGKILLHTHAGLR